MSRDSKKVNRFSTEITLILIFFACSMGIAAEKQDSIKSTSRGFFGISYSQSANVEVGSIMIEIGRNFGNGKNKASCLIGVNRGYFYRPTYQFPENVGRINAFILGLPYPNISDVGPTLGVQYWRMFAKRKGFSVGFPVRLNYSLFFDSDEPVLITESEFHTCLENVKANVFSGFAGVRGGYTINDIVNINLDFGFLISNVNYSGTGGSGESCGVSDLLVGSQIGEKYSHTLLTNTITGGFSVSYSF